MNKKDWFIRAIRFALVIIFLSAVFAPGGNALSPETVRAAADQPQEEAPLSENNQANQAGNTQEPTPTPEQNSPYFSSQTVSSSEGKSMDVTVIAGPPQPPAGYEQDRQPVELSAANAVLGSKTLEVPAYDWVFGCSATSGAMIAAYYDRNGYANMYTGPSSGGVMPLNNSQWPKWTDGAGAQYGQNPLAASRQGLDGRGSRGSFDNYWVASDSSVQDPFITHGWAEHAYGDAIGDYMRTSQSNYENVDGATTFVTWTSDPSPLTCDVMESEGINYDGTVGRRKFYKAKGYTVTSCYNQKTSNVGGGFTFASYKSEIDAGRPVMLNLQGHTIVGFGYDDSSNTIYIHDTWDYQTHAMPWGGSYMGMQLLSVSIVNLATTCSTPSVPPLTGPTNGATVSDDTPTLNWNPGTNANLYDLQIDNNSDFSSPIVNATNLSSLNYTATNALPYGTYYWRVRGHNTNGGCNTYSGWSTGWSFMVNLNGALPGAFDKSTPIDGTSEQPLTPTLSWGTSPGATSYEYCYDTSPDGACSNWINNGKATSKTLSGLGPLTTYYWQVRAANGSGFTYANKSAMWSFTTRSKDFFYLPMIVHQKPAVTYSGKVLYDNTPMAGITVKMAYTTDYGSNWSSYATATTDSQGAFTFAGTPEVGGAKGFSVYYDNPTSNPSYLWYFECNLVDSPSDPFTCTMNLRDVVMMSPAKYAEVGPTVNFAWTPRATTSDNYEWRIIDYDNQWSGYIDNLGYVSSVKISFCEFETYYWFDWRIDVLTPDGFGVGYEDRPILFNSMTAVCPSSQVNQPDTVSLQQREESRPERSPLLNWLLSQGQLAYPEKQPGQE